MANCKICNNPAESIMSFGQMPIANGFLENPAQEEFFFELSIRFCPKCFMVQLGETVPPEKMFNAHYHFISSTSKAMAEHFKEYAQKIMSLVAEKKDPFVVELGCNDGIMLKHVAQAGIRHLGVEPSSNVASLARRNGVEVTEEFFNVQTADAIAAKRGKADVICGANVLCHIEDINSVFEGVSHLLKEDGVFFFEDPYLMDIVKKSSFDQIYDEHVYYYSGLSVRELARRHGLELVELEPQDVHGGSMRYYIRKATNKPGASVEAIIVQEKELKLDNMQGYVDFKNKVNKVCGDLRNLLKALKAKGERIVAYGATSKSTTLLNYAKIGPEIIDYISDITPTKINKFTPGMHIPVKAYDAFSKDSHSYTLLLAWNHKKEILKKEAAYRERGGKFITYFPEVVVD